MSILAVAAAIAAPGYASSLSNYRANLAARRLAGDLAMAQASARAASESRIVAFNTAGHWYTISGVTRPDRAAGTYGVRLADPPYNAVISTLTFTTAAATDAVTFDGYGVPDRGLTLVVRAGGTSRTVTVDATTGAASVQ